MTKPVIRRAVVADAKAISTLYALEAAMQEQFGGYPLTPDFAWERWLEQHLRAPGHHLFVAEIDGAVAGYIHARRPQAAPRRRSRPAIWLRRLARQALRRPTPLPAPAQIGGWGYIESIYVAEPSRRQGIGRQLAERALEALTESGAVRIGISVMHANGSAMAFWRSLDFEPLRLMLTRDSSPMETGTLT